jgi:hypothetical protein
MLAMLPSKAHMLVLKLTSNLPDYVDKKGAHLSAFFLFLNLILSFIEYILTDQTDSTDVCYLYSLTSYLPGVFCALTIVRTIVTLF